MKAFACTHTHTPERTCTFRSERHSTQDTYEDTGTNQAPHTHTHTHTHAQTPDVNVSGLPDGHRAILMLDVRDTHIFIMAIFCF